MEDVTKLPKWAQSKIRVLEDNIAHLKKQIGQIFEPATTSIRWGINLQTGDDGIHGLPDDSPIKFYLTNDGKDRRYIQIMLSKDKEYISIMGSRGISILPASGNYIFIALKD